jgi:hypothetical protein
LITITNNTINIDGRVILGVLDDPIMISRYLFRDDVLIADGTTLQSFDEVSLEGDYLLNDKSYIYPGQWLAYRMTWIDYPTPRWNWISQPDSVVQHLRTLLLLQKS